MPPAFRAAFFGLLALLLLSAPDPASLPAEGPLPAQETLAAGCEYWMVTGHWALYYDCLRRQRQEQRKHENCE